MSDKHFKLFVIGVLSIGLLVYGKFLFSPILYGIFFAVLFAAPIAFFQKYLKWYPLAFLVTILISLLGLSILVTAVGFQISSLSFNLSEQLNSPDKLLNKLEEALQNVPFLRGLRLEDMTSQLGGLVEKVAAFLQFFIQSSGSFFVNIGLALIFSYYFGAYFDKAQNIVFNQVSDRMVSKFEQILTESSKVMRGYVVGLLIVSAVLAVLNGIGFLLVGLDHAIFWAIFVALFAIIPYVGPFISIIVVILYSFISSNGLSEPAFVMLSFIIVQQIEGNFITPKVVGDKIDINPLVVIILILFFGTIWGVEGIIICLPLAGVIKTFIDGLNKNSPISQMIEAE